MTRNCSQCSEQYRHIRHWNNMFWERSEKKNNPKTVLSKAYVHVITLLLDYCLVPISNSLFVILMNKVFFQPWSKMYYFYKKCLFLSNRHNILCIQMQIIHICFFHNKIPVMKS